MAYLVEEFLNLNSSIETAGYGYKQAMFCDALDKPTDHISDLKVLYTFNLTIDDI